MASTKIGTLRQRQYWRAIESQDQAPQHSQLLEGQDRIYGENGQVPVYDWIVPKGNLYPLNLRTYLDRPNRVLLEQDVFYGDPGQTYVTDWTQLGIPSQGHIRQIAHEALLSQITQNLLNTSLVLPELIPDGKQIFPDKLLPGVFLHPSLTSIVIQGLLNQILSGQDIFDSKRQVVSTQSGLPVQGIYEALRAQVIQNLLNTLFIVPPAVLPEGKQLFPSQFLIPVDKIRTTELRTFIQSLVNTTLLGQDIFYGDFGQPPSYDHIIKLPPKGKVPSVVLKTFLLSLVNTVLLSQDKIYADPGQTSARSLPLPPSLPEPFNVQDAISLLNTLLGVAPPAELPVGVREYKLLPAFIMRLRAIQSQLFVDLLLNTLQSKDIFYGGEGQTITRDWTQLGLTPAHPRPIDIRQVQNLLNTLLEIPPVGIPEGKQSTEILPVLKKLRIALKAQEDVTVDLLLGVLLGQDTIYTAPGQVPAYDQTLPAAISKRPTIEQIQNLLNTLIGQIKIPEGQQEIQYIRLPLIKALFIALLAQATSDLLLTTLANQDRLYGDPGQVQAFDWQVPRGYVFPSDLRSFIAFPSVDTLSALGIPVAVTLRLYSGRLTSVLKDATISIRNISGILKIVLEKKANK